MPQTNRTPPANIIPGKRGKCPMCNKQYTDNCMVECTQCKKWIHYLCAGVDDTVVNDDVWKCIYCVKRNQSQIPSEQVIVNETPSTSHVGHKSSSLKNASIPTNSTNAMPIPNLQSQGSTSAPNIQTVTETPSRTSGKITKPANKAESIRSVSSRSSRGSIIRAKQKMLLLEEQNKILEEKEKMLKEQQALLDQLDDDEIEEMFDNMTVKSSTESIPKSNTVQKPFDNKVINYDLFPELNSTLKYIQPEKVVKVSNQSKVGNTTTQKSLHTLEPTRQFEHPKVTKVMPQYEAASIEAGCTLTAEQSAARHIIAKDLPTFTGDPEQWPLFISSFHQTTIACGLSDTENLYRLQKCLKGKAREMVEAQLTLATCVPKIIETLRSFFGRPELLLDRHLQKIRSLPPPRIDRLDSLVSFATAVNNLTTMLEQADMHDHLNNPMLVKEIVDKLPSSLRMQWASFKREIEDGDTDMESLAEWLQNQAADAATVMSGTEWSNIIDKSTQNKGKKESVHVHTEDSIPRDEREKTCLTCKRKCSTVADCNWFKNATLSQRWEKVKSLKLCRQCLKKHGNRCFKSDLCGENGCNRRHHKLLHNPSKTPDQTTNAQNENEVNLSHRASKLQVRFRILPVILRHGSNQIQTFAFMDEGSSSTLISQNIASQLGLNGMEEPLCLKWSDSTSRLDSESQIVDFEISGTYKNAPYYPIKNVRTVKTLELPTQSMDYKKLSDSYAHLLNLPIQSYHQAKSEIMIGLKNWNLGLPLKVREGDVDEPIAAKCRLGWTIFAASNHTDEYVNVHVCECNSTQNDELKQLMKDYFSIDCLGIMNSKEQEDEELATKMMSKIVTYKDNKYTSGLLWKSPNIKLPDSRPMAIQRLKCLENRLKADNELASKIKQQISDYIKKGYIRKLDTAEVAQHQNKVWYLPIFPVFNPNKPNKVRLVWDAAAKVNGFSLNSFLMKGADLNSSLLGVLLRSREKKICVCGDIKEMFHQIEMSESDQQVLRFLWRDCENREPDTYVMKVMTFGATCSPFTAQYVKNQNALKYVEHHPIAVDCIIRNHYVDDLLASFDTVEEAVAVSLQVKKIHASAGFEIHNWKSNSTDVMQILNPDSTDTSINMNVNRENLTEKVLGMWWCLTSDQYTYSLRYNKGGEDVLNGSRKPTKREVLKTLMSIYDPLGLIANFLIYLKILLQDIWRSGIDWDEQITDAQFEDWLIWLKQLPKIEDVRISRCYLRSFQNWENLNCQLHVFVDAGENACAAVVYIRVSQEEKVECSLIAAKTKVAPIKLRTIPRLELDAALMGCRLWKQVMEQLTIKIHNTTFWTDSKTVHSWLKNDPRLYSKYVGFRVTEIQENSNINQWRYVPSNLNVADDATKNIKPSKSIKNDRWITGPEFLYNSEEFWPPANNKSDKQTQEEMSLIHSVHPMVHFDVIDIDCTRFSSWKKLINTTAYVQRFVNNIKNNIKNKNAVQTGILTQEELQKSELTLFKVAQSEGFREEIKILYSAKSKSVQQSVPKSSAIHKLSPYLDENNLLRVHGRLENAPAEIELNTRRPIILPNNHHITSLIVQNMHEQFNHQFNESVVNKLKEKFMITKLRRLVKSTQKKCQHCKVTKARPSPPQMAPLPAARLAITEPPFTYVGVDFFGPLTVTVGRRSEKRWGVIFTCLTIRAIHTEISHSLRSDAFILCLHNFIARRGTPKEIFCDRGTNFVGAEKILKEELQKFDSTLVAKQFVSPDIKWNFNPPASPHMGGAWERLIKSLKNAMYASLPRSLTDPILQSCIIAAEDIVNSRPLTYVSTDEFQEALTPNHFLKQSSAAMKPSCMINDDAKCLRQAYQYKEQFANKCWKRFISEYLPELTLRSKWFKRTQPIQVDDIVVIIDKELQRNNYPKGKVIEVKVAKDGQVRSAKVQTSEGIYERPAVKIAVLDVSPPNDTGYNNSTQ